MTNQRINGVDTITTIANTDRILVNTDVVNNVLEQIEKDDFVADIISTDANNAIEVGTDNKLKTKSTVTLQGNTFNGNSQLIQTTAAGQYPALDGSLITGVGAEVNKTVIQIGTSSTASATSEKAVTLSGFVLATGVTLLVSCSTANTAATPTLNINSTRAKALKFKDGITVDATHPAPINLANRKMLVTYDGTNYIIQENAIYDSGWFTVTVNSTYTKTHNLGTSNIKYFVLVADDANGTNQRPAVDDFANGSSSYCFWYGATTTTTLQIKTNATNVGIGVDGGGMVTPYYRIIAEVIQ